jgi:hypothetical protein
MIAFEKALLFSQTSGVFFAIKEYMRTVFDWGYRQTRPSS